VLPLCGAAASPREAGVLTIAVYTDFEPFSQVTAGECAGIDVSLARRLAERLNLKLKLLPFNAGESMADDLRNMVWRGDVLHYGPADVMLHVPVDRRFSAANDQALIFAPYYRESLVLVRDTRVLPAAPTAADLIGKFLAAEQGTAAASALLGAESGALREKIRMTPTPQAALRLVLKGQVAAALVTRAQAEAALHSASDGAAYAISELVLNGIPPRGWAVGMAVKADNTELAGQIAQALQTMSDNGELHEIFAAEGLTLVDP
jgi:ABC-type amino acid transport substrate-binding protein